MKLRSDEQTLLRFYDRLIADKEGKKKAVEAVYDRVLAKGIETGADELASKLILAASETEPAPENLKQLLISAKGNISQYGAVKGRNPACVSPLLTQNIEKLIKATVKCEARLLNMLRQREPGGMQLNLEKAISEKDLTKHLGLMTIDDMVMNVLIDARNRIKEAKYFISGTGSKYHRHNCPYCRGKKMEVATEKYITLLDMSPCKCLELPCDSDSDNKYMFVTAFIDESIHEVEWAADGREGKVGNFGYIICAGNLSDETKIKEKSILAKGIDYTKENKRVELVTESAIGKVLMTLAYDFEYTGNVVINTDNMNASKYWKGAGHNLKLAGLFESVEVRYIPRKQNKKSDNLLRTNIHMSMTVQNYREIVETCKKAHKLEARVKELEKELAINKKNSFLDVLKNITGDLKALFFNQRLNDNGINNMVRR